MAFEDIRLKLNRFSSHYFASQHLLMVMLVVAVILQSILIAGCSSTAGAMTNVYLVSFQYASWNNETSVQNSTIRNFLTEATSDARLEVRIAYFGICISDPGNGAWICSNDANHLSSAFDDSSDPLHLITNSVHFKDDVVFPYLIIVSIALEVAACCLLATFPRWHEEQDAVTGSDVDVKPFPDRIVSQSVLALSFLSAVFVLVSAFWQHYSSSAAATTLEFALFGVVRASVGSAAAGLIWTSFFFTTVVTAWLAVMILSIFILDKLTDG